MNRSGRGLHWLVWLLASIAFGFFALGGLAYELFIGLDWTAYPMGSTIHGLFDALGLAGENAVSGLFYIVIGLIGVGVVAGIAMTRTAPRAFGEPMPSPGRRPARSRSGPGSARRSWPVVPRGCARCSGGGVRPSAGRA